jgi:type I restriction-modification system DNA methylase subunit
MPDIKITEEIRAVLDECEFTETTIKLPDKQLDRKLYVKINALFEECGGSWNRKLKAHVFPSNPKGKLGLIVEEGVLVDKQKLTQKFYTPQWLVEKIVSLADVKGKTVLEPSCGDGRVMRECIKQGAKEVTGVDILPECELFNVTKGDFLQTKPEELVDVICGNPPFSRTDWLKHTLHAYKFVKPGGKLVFILPNSIHSNKKFQEFVKDKVWEWKKIPGKSFEDTDIETNIVTIWK